MSRLTELTTETMTEEQRNVYERTRPGRQDGPLRGPSSAWVRSPKVYERLGWMVMFMRHDSVIPARLVEFVILMTVGHWGAEYPWGVHARMAKENGVGDGVIAAIKAGDRPEFTEADEEAVYDFCTELRERHAVSDGTYKATLGHLGEQGVVELVALIGQYTTVSMTVNAFEIPAV